jgi:hypothetical protein
MAVDKSRNKLCRLVGGTFAHCISSLGAVNKYAAISTERTYICRRDAKKPTKMWTGARGLLRLSHSLL